VRILHIIVLGTFFLTNGSVSLAHAQESANGDFTFWGLDIPFPLVFGGLDTELPELLFEDEEDAAVSSFIPEYIDPHVENAKEQGEKKEKALKAVKHKLQNEREVIVTAYSSTVDQTDSSPCITANGFNVCEHNRENVVAANFLPFGTRVRLPDIYGAKVFTVQDRMHPRYASRVDIWMKTRIKARKFGVRRSKIEILSEHVALQR
jgi:3D (Asp-Asp-Asp) domain-containing protein